MKGNRHKQAQRSEFKALRRFWPGICNKTFSQPALKRKPTQAPFAIQPKHRAATHSSPLNVPSAPSGCAKGTNTEAVGGQETSAAQQSIFQSRVIRAHPTTLIPFLAVENREKWLGGCWVCSPPCPGEVVLHGFPPGMKLWSGVPWTVWGHGRKGNGILCMFCGHLQ